MHVAVAICKRSIAMCTCTFPAGATMVVRARSADLRIAYRVSHIHIGRARAGQARPYAHARANSICAMR